MIPVPTGTIAAPKKRKAHKRTVIYVIEYRKPIGNAKTKATTPNDKQSFNALIEFLPLYPPYLSAKVPPTITPPRGAVIDAIEKVKSTITGSFPRMSIRYDVIQNCIPVTMKYIEHKPSVTQIYKELVITSWDLFIIILLPDCSKYLNCSFL